MKKYRYSSAFMQHTNMNQPSANRIVPVVLSLLEVESVADFGCAYGSWLRVWQENGVGEILGLDGDYVERDHLQIAQEQFKCFNIAMDLDLERKFDLVQSLEVAEHIDHGKAQNFVRNLTRHGSAVLFSSAPPGQGGEWHINEQPYSYWRDLFAQEGYGLFDCIRPLIKNASEIQSWYRYNIFLYVHKDRVATLPEAVTKFHIPDTAVIPDVSPPLYKIRKAMVRLLPGSIQNRVAKWRSIQSSRES